MKNNEHEKSLSLRSVFHLCLRHFTLAILATIVLSGCGSGGGGGGGSSGSGSASVGMVVISGNAVDDPVEGASVAVSSANGTELASVTTDNSGRFSVEVEKSAIQDGYSIRVTGGIMRGEPFTGELRASYSAAEDPASANVTLITTLISALTETIEGTSTIQKRDAAIGKLVLIGVLSPSEWSRVQPASVDMHTLRQHVA